MNTHNSTNRFVLTRCPLQYPDHDFESSGYKILPSGYLFLVRKTDSKDIKRLPPVNSGLPQREYVMNTDKHGRVHISTPNSGELYMRNRGSPWFSASVLNHLVDLREILHERYGKEGDKFFGTLRDFLVTT